MAGEGAEDLPRTRVSLVLICEGDETRRAVLGDEVGACYAIEAGGSAILRARCWWGGQGALVEVRRDEGTLGVWRAAIEEETGVGDFEPRATLEVPGDADVEPL